MESVGKGSSLYDLDIYTLDKLLTYLAKLIGIKNENLPDKEEMIIIIQALVKNFGSMHEEELKSAFEMYASGRLDADEHFQSYSFKSISNIINAYRREVNRLMRYTQSTIRPITTEIKEVDWTDVVTYLQSELKQGKDVLIPVAIYEWLQIKEGLNPTKEEKINAFNKAKVKLKLQLEDEMIGKINKDNKTTIEKLDTCIKGDAIHTMITNEAKKILIRNHLINDK